MMAMYERYTTRAAGFLLGYSQIYPPFDLNSGSANDNAYPPVQLQLPTVADAAPDSLPRSAALNVFKAIPHYIVLMIFFIGAAVVAVIGWFAVLITGTWPHGMRDYLVRVNNYYYRVWTYVTMVQNDYPAFGLPAH